MAKESMKAREVKRAKLVARYAEKRAALKQIVRTGDPAEAFEAAQKLQDLPKNSNPIRMHNRCKLTGRPKGYIRQFGISRIQFREMASNGLIPVSYTHLDVYKRQRYRRSRRTGKGSGRPFGRSAFCGCQHGYCAFHS